jgi:hypothetical protein
MVRRSRNQIVLVVVLGLDDDDRNEIGFGPDC